MWDHPSPGAGSGNEDADPPRSFHLCCPVKERITNTAEGRIPPHLLPATRPLLSLGREITGFTKHVLYVNVKVSTQGPWHISRSHCSVLPTLLQLLTASEEVVPIRCALLERFSSISTAYKGKTEMYHSAGRKKIISSCEGYGQNINNTEGVHMIAILFLQNFMTTHSHTCMQQCVWL